MMRWNEAVWKRTQAVVLWALGAAGIANELFIVDKPRIEAWPIIFGLLGLPLVSEADRARRTSGSSTPQPGTEPPDWERAP